MDKKIKILALFGKSGAGKDTILKWMVSYIPNTKRIVNYTTRPRRQYERDNYDYHFTSVEKFGQMLLDGSLIEATSFNDWFYGTSFDELDADRVNVGVFNITAIECLLEDSRLDVLPVQIEANDITRLRRNLNREKFPNCTEICRRFLADEEDFDDSNISFEYEEYLNKNSNTDWFNIQNIPAIKSFLEDKSD